MGCRDNERQPRPFKCRSLRLFVLSITSLLTFLADVVTDILVCIELLARGQTVLGWVMVAFMTSASVIMGVVSLVWMIDDKKMLPPTVVSHLLLIAPVERYLKVQLLSIKSFRSQSGALVQATTKEMRDACLLRLVQAFLQSAPHLVLQFYVILCLRWNGWLIEFSAAISLVSMTWAVTVYSYVSCNASTSKTCLRLLVHWLWQVFMTSSRVLAFVFFACVLGYWLLGVLGVHWLSAFLLMTWWGRDFKADPHKWTLRLTCSFIYIFIFLNFGAGKSKWRMMTYYVLVLLENVGMLVTFLMLDEHVFVLVPCLGVVAAFFLGLLFLITYYTCLHRPASPSLKLLQTPTCFRELVGSDRGAASHIFSIESPPPAISSTLRESKHLHGSPAPLQNTNNGHQHFHHTLTEPTGHRLRWRDGLFSRLQALELTLPNGTKLSSSSSTSWDTESLGGLVSCNSSVKSETSGGSVWEDNQRPTSVLPQVQSTVSDTLGGDLPLGDSGGQKAAEAASHCQAFDQSPTPSRDSWSELSKHFKNPKPDVWAPDQSSTAEKKSSDSSSFCDQLPGLSSTSVSSGWKDAQIQLKTTISATVAAATGNLSFTPSTTGRIQTDSSSYLADSGQNPRPEERLSVDQLQADGVFRDSESLQLSDLNCTKKTEKSLLDVRSRMLAEVFSHCSSPQLLDSTLTVSKLGTQQSGSYLADQMKKHVSHLTEDGHHLTKSVPPSLNSTLDYALHYSTSTFSNSLIATSDSAFTDQELVSVMAQSLKKYLSDSVLVDSNQPEREGLALTLEDLSTPPDMKSGQRKSPDIKPDSSLDIKQDSSLDMKPDSGSSLDMNPDSGTLPAAQVSTDSSPASSAAAMTAAAEVKADEKLSPDGLKQIHSASSKLVECLADITDSALMSAPYSLALKLIMESYNSTNPHTALPRYQPSQNYAFCSPVLDKHLHMCHESQQHPVLDKTLHMSHESEQHPVLDKHLHTCYESQHHCALDKPLYMCHESEQHPAFDKPTLLSVPLHRRHTQRLLQTRRYLFSVETSSAVSTPHGQHRTPNNATLLTTVPANHDPIIHERVHSSHAQSRVSVTKKLCTYYNQQSPLSEHEQEDDSQLDLEERRYVLGQYQPPLYSRTELKSPTVSEIVTSDLVSVNGRRQLLPKCKSVKASQSVRDKV